jgi:hypothetical protein
MLGVQCAKGKQKLQHYNKAEITTLDGKYVCEVVRRWAENERGDLGGRAGEAGGKGGRQQIDVMCLVSQRLLQRTKAPGGKRKEKKRKTKKSRFEGVEPRNKCDTRRQPRASRRKDAKKKKMQVEEQRPRARAISEGKSRAKSRQKKYAKAQPPQKKTFANRRKSAHSKKKN